MIAAGVVANFAFAFLLLMVMAMTLGIRDPGVEALVRELEGA